LAQNDILGTIFCHHDVTDARSRCVPYVDINVAQPERIDEADRVPADICINSFPRRDFIVRERIFPRRFSG
jgi:hypothetical protein